ncbi:STE3-like pheromone receptor [Laccaria bicolor S238N-H82]|uniref:STE3-like pheromone receptor n=1 Tax=Laccaria bicolor (strain S238N-H82 / ATCC MYA-4686) TaxID=486041 RepID=B0DXD7_LACBS|nr:STE3-like pheromone receptor [Laccaria bicolor S238N-H82]EDR00818.1 STE3-like pheromone receptor [Laccaria bicolor S238N-H82]|eukprot:XP_001888610.1 STE3-like pheromone receptor [Laccaria bicolor S238N-H82]
MPTDASYPAFPIFAFIAFVLVLIPLPWHFQAWNSGTCLFMIWTAVGCLNLFINSIVWRNNAIDWAPIWCDISSRIIVGLAVAIPAASLCINRRLYKIASCRTVTITRAHKRRAVMVDLAIGLGLPALQMALQFIVQGHRYDIWEGVGCYPTTVNTPAAYPLSFLWPIVIGLISAFYCILTLRAFMLRRAQFAQFVSSTTSLTMNRYFRLMSLATLELIFNLPINTYGLYLNITSRPIYPWKSWSDIHYDWFTIDTFPSILWRSNSTLSVTLEFSRWSVVFCALLFFGFFGFADEARKHYRLAYWAIAKRFGVTPPPSSLGGKVNPGSAKPSLPGFVPRPLELKSSKSDSFSSSASTFRTSFNKSDYTTPSDATPIHTTYKSAELSFPTTPTTPSTISGMDAVELTTTEV